jgi:hypothetical protein
MELRGKPYMPEGCPAEDYKRDLDPTKSDFVVHASDFSAGGNVSVMVAFSEHGHDPRLKGPNGFHAAGSEEFALPMRSDLGQYAIELDTAQPNDPRLAALRAQVEHRIAHCQGVILRPAEAADGDTTGDDEVTPQCWALAAEQVRSALQDARSQPPDTGLNHHGV